MKRFLSALGITALAVTAFPTAPVSAQTTAQRLSGRILLQVQSAGEAWYINPDTQRRHFMGRPHDAFNLMRNLGVGVSNTNIEKFPIAFTNYWGPDTDTDGLSDVFEDAIGTNKNLEDSDGDGYNDFEEVKNDYSPLGPGRPPFDTTFASQQKGKILLAVERHGEAWYINPVDGRRYFLGRPSDAFAVMRGVGLGITNNDIETIPDANEQDAPAPTSTKPDLVVINLTYKPSTINPGTTVTFTIHEKNIGSQTAGSHKLSFERLGGPGASVAAIEAIGAGRTITGDLPWTCPDDGTYTFEAKVDIDNVINEDSETNNSRKITIRCGNPSTDIQNTDNTTQDDQSQSDTTQDETDQDTSVQQPDLIIESFATSGTTRDIGESFTFEVREKNRGNTTAGNHTVTVYDNSNNTVFTKSLSGLSANNTNTLSGAWTCQTPGTYTFKAVTDATQRVNESDESNNEKTLTVSCISTAPPTSCSDGTSLNKCSTKTGSEGKYCNTQGQLVDNAAACGCPGKFIKNNACVSTSTSGAAQMSISGVFPSFSSLKWTREVFTLSQSQYVDLQIVSNDPLQVDLRQGEIPETETDLGKYKLILDTTVGPTQTSPRMGAWLGPGTYTIMYKNWTADSGKNGFTFHRLFRTASAKLHNQNIFIRRTSVPSSFSSKVDLAWWQSELQKGYQAMENLVGRDSKLGTTLEYIFTDMQYCGLAGNPIRIQTGQNCWPEVLQGDAGWGPLHEMGHVFAAGRGDSENNIGNTFIWNSVSSEAFASFLAFYAYDVQAVPPMKSANPFNRQYFDDHRLTYTTSDRDWREVGTDEIVGLFLALKDEYGWQIFKSMFQKYNAADLEGNPTERERVEHLVQMLGESAEQIRSGGQQEVYDQFEEWNFPLP